jgi:hypothetical protein
MLAAQQPVWIGTVILCCREICKETVIKMLIQLISL